MGFCPEQGSLLIKLKPSSDPGERQRPLVSFAAASRCDGSRGFRRGFGGRGVGPPRRWLAARVGEVQSTSKARVVVYLISNRRLIEKIL